MLGTNVMDFLDAGQWNSGRLTNPPDDAQARLAI
jgi:hypothetical protein